MRTTIGRLLFNEAVPEEFREGMEGSPVGSKEIDRILASVADRRPEAYKDISFALLKLGTKGSVETNTSFTLDDLKSPVDKSGILSDMRLRERAIMSDGTIDKSERDRQLTELYRGVATSLPDKVFGAALEKGSNLARMVASGARGNKSQLNSNVGADILVSDSQGKPVLVPITRNYAEGLSPAEYFAASFGTRLGLVSTKLAVQDAGFFSKQLAAAAQDLVVTERDCGTSNGIAAAPADKANVGAVLARDTGGYAAGTIITPKVAGELSRSLGGDGRIVVRSPLACSSRQGICSRCAGIREHGRFPDISENVGLAAASGVAEPVSQSMLCLAPWTRVRMADGSVKEIRNIRVGELVLGSDLAGRLRPVSVTAVYENGLRSVWSTKFKLGKNQGVALESTLDHKILCSWHKSGCSGEALNFRPQVLPVGQVENGFAAHLPSGFDDTGLPDDPWALFVGLVLGDGCCTESVGSTHFSCADPLLLSDVEGYLASLNLKLTKLTGHDYYYRFSQIDDPDHERDPVSGRYVSGSRYNPANGACVEYGMQGKYALAKEIPDRVWGWSNRSVADLIGGLFATDGSIYLAKDRRHKRLRISFGSTSLAMLARLRELLLFRFGIRSTEHAPRVVGQFMRNPLHTFSVSDSDSVHRFIDNIPVPGVKSRKLAEWKGLVAAARKGPRCKRIKGHTYLGDFETYDLQVDHPDHLFVLENGLVVSNSTKHSAGVASAGGGSNVTGFPAINALSQVPKIYPGGAILSERDGRVSKVEKAPQGGWNVHIGDWAGHIPSGKDVTVREGDVLEAGDTVSSGTPSPAEIVRHKGVGAGRRYWVEAMQKSLAASGTNIDRRNLEVVARAVVNHVEAGDGDDVDTTRYMPGDVIEYGAWQAGYRKSPETVQAPPSQSVGRYLQTPALHYTIGTRITPSVAKDLESVGFSAVDVSDSEPGFRPRMIRLMDAPAYKDDWMTHTGQSYAKRNLKSDIQSGGAESLLHGIHMAPSLARGIEFGRPGAGKIGY